MKVVYFATRLRGVQLHRLSVPFDMVEERTPPEAITGLAKSEVYSTVMKASVAKASYPLVIDVDAP